MKKSFYLLFIICGIAATFLFSTCEKDVKVSGIIVEPKSLYLSKGDVTQLAYMVTPYSADNKSIKWRSDDTTIATVSATGLVTAISEGKTQITATTDDGHFTDVVSVTVMRGSPAGDSIALIKLYEIAYSLPAWDFTKPMDQWGGVVLNSHRRVEFIYNFMISISGPLDASIGDLACLKYLGLQCSYYAGNNITIPAEIGRLTDLQTLSLCNNFSGTIPSELGNLINLKRLYLVDNQLTENIPSEFGNLANLTVLSLYKNQLTGNIPKELGNLTNLETLSLSDNQLTGNIPKELGNLAKLNTLYLTENYLTGEIPRELENLRNLWDLGLSHNSLSGTIPPSLLERFDRWSFCPQNGTNFDNYDCGGY